MPLDINLFRADRGGDPEKIRESQRRRFKPAEAVDEIIAKDNAWRKLTGDIDYMKKDRNAVQKEIGTKMKAKEACDDLVATKKRLDSDILQAEKDVEVLKRELDSMVSKIGNIVDPSVPVSKDEDADNLVIRTWGTPRDPAGLLNHHDLLWRVGGYEPERGVAVAGHRGYFLKDVGVLLNQAFQMYGTAFLRARGYTVLQPPFMMKKEVMSGVAQLEQFDEELYKVGSEGDEEKYLIATSEQPICGYHMGEWIPEKDLPIRIAGTSTCFRKEAGAHGKDTWGIFRVHQFEKIEQFAIVEGDLDVSQKMQEEMSATAEEFYRSLGFPYRVISIVSGALNNAAIKKLDLECWFPGYNAFRELVSCSNCTDYQSRAMEIRCGVKKLGDTEKKYVHMLNATLCATGRAICCLLETYQEADGVRIPEVLVPYMGGITFLPFVRESRLPAGAPKVAAAPAKPPAPVAAAKQALPPPPAGETALPPASQVSLSPEAEEIRQSIERVAGEIREKKAAKASKDDVKALVDQLLQLKTSFTEATGMLFGPPMVPVPTVEVVPGGAKKEGKKETKKEAPPKPAPAVAAAAPAVPVHPPASVTSSIPRRTRISLPTPSSVWKQETVDMTQLEEQLRTHSYVSGFQPSAEDLRVISALIGGASDAEQVKTWCLSNPFPQLPQTSRWVRNVGSFSAETIASWK